MQQSLLTCMKPNWIYPESSHKCKDIPSITRSLMTKPCEFSFQTGKVERFFCLFGVFFAFIPAFTNFIAISISVSLALFKHIMSFSKSSSAHHSGWFSLHEGHIPLIYLYGLLSERGDHALCNNYCKLWPWRDSRHLNASHVLKVYCCSFLLSVLLSPDTMQTSVRPSPPVTRRWTLLWQNSLVYVTCSCFPFC